MPDSLVVFLRGSGSPAALGRTTDALKEHSPDIRVVGAEEGGDRAVWDVLRREPEADVVLLQIGVEVGPGWHESLRAAAYEDAVIATASAVPAELLALSDGPPAPRGDRPHGAALGEPLWGCVYARRDAVEVALAARAGGSDATPAPLEDLLLVPGLVHVLASTVVSARRDDSAAGNGGFLTPSVRRALARLEAEVEPLRVTVDLRCCSNPLTGTQVHALNLVRSLAAIEELQLSALLPAYVHPSVRPHVDALPPTVRRVRGEAAGAPPQVFHRPNQLLTENEITDVLSRGSRLVVTHQDMILDRTPAYFSSKADWRGYTAASALSFVAADEVAFFSEHARNEAIRDGLVDPAKTSVVPPGTNHLDGASGDEARPAEVRREHEPFVLVLCNAYLHKNRVFALRVFDELGREHGWRGALVFAGGTPPDGSSAADERAFLAAHPELRARFVDLGRVGDDEQRWLYRNAALVLYPTLYEGFGLIPFEAAAAGTPCVYSSRSSVAEFLPAEGAVIDVADVAATAKRVAEVLADAAAGEEIVRAIRLAGTELTWERAAASYARLYRRALERPVGLSLASGGEVIVGARSQVAADDTERRLLLASRRVGPLRLAAKAAFALAISFVRLVRRG